MKRANIPRGAVDAHRRVLPRPQVWRRRPECFRSWIIAERAGRRGCRPWEVALQDGLCSPLDGHGAQQWPAIGLHAGFGFELGFGAGNRRRGGRPDHRAARRRRARPGHSRSLELSGWKLTCENIDRDLRIPGREAPEDIRQVGRSDPRIHCGASPTPGMNRKAPSPSLSAASRRTASWTQ